MRPAAALGAPRLKAATRGALSDVVKTPENDSLVGLCEREDAAGLRGGVLTSAREASAVAVWLARRAWENAPEWAPDSSLTTRLPHKAP